MTTLAIIQARSGSTRLPGKILQDLAGMPILAWVVRSARAATLIDDVVVATTTSPADDATVRACVALGVEVVRGPEDDVLTRFLFAMQTHPSDLVVRLTADCPLLDPVLIDATISLAASPAQPDYASTTLVRTLPRGLDVEVARASALMRADRDATGYHRTHVTSHLYAHSDEYKCLGVSTLLEAADLRVTVDTPDDLNAVRAIVHELGDDIPGAHEVVALLRDNPHLVRLNAHVEQKGITEG